MAKSFTTLRNLYGKFTKDTDTTNLTHGDELINDEYRTILSKRDWYFLHKLRTVSTTASTQFTTLPYDFEQVESVFVTVSSTRYTPFIIRSRSEWDRLNITTYTSDIPTYAYVYDGQVGLIPTPTSTGTVISVNGKVRVKDLNIADITSSTITTLANGSAALTVNSGLTVQMAGLWIRPTYSTTANTGDGNWYEITSVTNATTATLTRLYGGTAIAAGTAASTIGQMPLLPEPFHATPVYKAAATYWYTEGNKTKGDNFMVLHKDGMDTLKTQYTSESSDPVVDEGIRQKRIINPNLAFSL